MLAFRMIINELFRVTANIQLCKLRFEERIASLISVSQGDFFYLGFIHLRMCACQGVRNVSFLENFAYVLTG